MSCLFRLTELYDTIKNHYDINEDIFMVLSCIVFALAAFCAFVCAVITYKKKTHLTFVTGTMFLAACAVNLT